MGIPSRVGRTSVALLLLLAACDASRDGGTAVRDEPKSPPRVDAGIPAPSGPVIGPPSTPPLTLTLKGAEGAAARENGERATLEVGLTAAPTGDVTVELSSTKPDQLVVETKQVTLSATQTSAPVIVAAVDDASLDGNVEAEVVARVIGTRDPRVNSATSVRRSVVALDNDKPLLALAEDVSVLEGQARTLRVRLLQPPVKPVKLRLTSQDDELVAGPAVLVQPGVLEAMLAVEAKDNALLDGSRTRSVVIDGRDSEDPAFAAAPPIQARVTLLDNDRAGLEVSRRVLDVREGDSTEATVRLTSRPSSAVRVAVQVPAWATATPAAVTIEPDAWDRPVTLRLAVPQNSRAEGWKSGAVSVVATSNDDAYRWLSAGDISISTTDDDQPAVLAEMIGPDRVAEGQASGAKIRVRLGSEPAATVHLSASADPLAPQYVSFSSADWNQWKELELLAYDDDTVNGDRTGVLRVRVTYSNDSGYYGLVASTQPSVTVLDNDVASLVVETPEALVGAWGTTASVGVYLDKCVEASVTVPVTVDTPGRISLSTDALVFPSGTCGQRSSQRVTVQGIDHPTASTVTMGFGVTQSSLPGADKRPSVQAKVRVLGSDGNFRTTQLLSTSHVIAATPSGRHIIIEGSGCKGGEAFGAYLCDVQTGQGSGLLPQHVRRGVTLSDDASHLAFHTNRDGVVPFDNNGRYDVFGYEFASGRIRALNVGPEGWLGDAAAYLVETTNTRAYFISSASDLLPGAEGTLLYASDRATGRLSVESVDSTGAAVPILAAAAARGGAALAYRLATGEWVHRSLADSRIVPLLGEGDAAAASRLTLASDGASAFYQTRAADEHQAWKVVPGGAPVRINRDEANQAFPFLSEMVPSANGRYVALQEDTPAGSLYRVVDTTNGATRYALVDALSVLSVGNDGRTLLVRGIDSTLLRLVAP